MIALLLALSLCGTADDPGFTMYDGTCMTVSRYNETFSAEALALVPSWLYPDRSVTEVYHLTPDVPADRPLPLTLVDEHLTFRILVTRHGVVPAGVFVV